MTSGVAPSPPDQASLLRAALDYLARYAASRATLTGVLDRHIERWAARAEKLDADAVAARLPEMHASARAIVARLAETGVIDDTAFAIQRARRLVRAGKSRAAIMAHLAGRGIDRAAADAAVPDNPETALLSALAFARKRRFGPFAPDVASPSPQRALAAFARAGFGRSATEAALGMSLEEAEARLRAGLA